MPEVKLIHSVEELEELWERSKRTPVWIFKHSLSCPISARAIEQYREFASQRPDGDEGLYALIEIQNARPVSDAVSARSGLRHESPQVLLLRSGAVCWHANHWAIRAPELNKASAETASAAEAGG